MAGYWSGGNNIARSSPLANNFRRNGVPPGAEIPPWTPDVIQALLGVLEFLRSGYERYFSCLHAVTLVRLLLETGRAPRGGRALDVGCGPGFLLKQLAAAGLTTCGVDFSLEALRSTSSTMAMRPNYIGVARSDGSLPFADGSFDALTCVETLEHLDTPSIEAMLGECHRVLKQDGIALFTTPCDEDLSRSLTFCPFCNTTFHSVLHVNSFSVEALGDCLARVGSESSCVADLTWRDSETGNPLGRTSVRVNVGTSLPARGDAC